MKPAEVDEIHAAIWAEPWSDPQLFPDLLNRAVAELGHMATSTCRCYPGGFSPETYEGPQRDCPLHGEPCYWAAEVLRALGNRARSGVSFGEPDEPAWSLDPEPRRIPTRSDL